MSSNPFVLAPEQYKRDIDVFKHYVKDSAWYLARMSGRPIEACEAFIRKSIGEDGQFEFQDPRILFLERGENGDREKKLGTLGEYLQDSVQNKDLIAPTLTTYIPHHVKQSLLVDYIDANVKARGVAKKAKFKAKMAGDKVTEAIKDNEQNNKKLANNAISGAHVSPSTPLYNKTAHSTLTSNCRSTSGYGNANNEKFLNGNRHYWSAEIVRNNIVSIITHSDFAAIENAMREFGIRAPSVEETMACIEYSARLYFRDKKDYVKIRALVERLTELERAAFVYTGDLYHLMRYNDHLVREFITRLSARIEPDVVRPYFLSGELESSKHPLSTFQDHGADGLFCYLDTAERGAELNARLHKLQEEHIQLASQICSPEMKGFTTEGIIATENQLALVLTAEHIGKVVQDYATLIRAFWVTENVPASVAYFPDSIRRAALTSDTDSTIFTVQDWVLWHQGYMSFSQAGNAVAATMIFLAAQTIIHVLARMSANFGIPTSRIHQVAMKNEYKFDVFVPTQVAKHYYALIGCQEGNLFREYDQEIKGVHLKSSNAPVAVIKEAKKMMENIMYSVVRGEKISISAILKQIGDVERRILADIGNGGSEFFRRAQIKTKESYTKSATESNYLHYLLWNEVFAPKYGEIQDPPYMCIKLGAELDTPTKAKEWLDKMEDQDLANRMREWMVKYNRRHFTTFLIPEQCVQSTGIPTELLQVIGTRKLVTDSTNVFKLILETLGIYYNSDTMLISDFY